MTLTLLSQVWCPRRGKFYVVTLAPNERTFGLLGLTPLHTSDDPFKNVEIFVDPEEEELEVVE